MSPEEFYVFEKWKLLIAVNQDYIVFKIILSCKLSLIEITRSVRGLYIHCEQFQG